MSLVTIKRPCPADPARGPRSWSVTLALWVACQVQRRREELEGARDLVASERSRMLGHMLPDTLRNYALKYDRAAFNLVMERHIRCVS